MSGMLLAIMRALGIRLTRSTWPADEGAEKLGRVDQFQLLAKSVSVAKSPPIPMPALSAAAPS